MANPTTNFGWVMPTSTDLVTDLPADFAVFGQAVDTSMADLKGGTTGQILAKATNTDMDFTWVTNDVGDITAVTAGTGISGGGTSGAVTITNSMATEITAKGDLIAGTGSATFDNLPVGTNGQTLVADSTASTGLKWATASSGGMTSLASGSLSSTSVSITGLSTSYNELLIIFNGVSLSGTDQPNFRFNADNGLNYYQATNSATAGTANSAANGGVLINTTIGAASTNNSWIIRLSNYTSTTSQKSGTWSCAFTNSAGTVQNIGGVFSYNSNTAITSVQFFASYGGSASFDAGTYVVYGVN
jgi:hypothetical protein